ncbi:nucleoside deaminase [Cyanobacterium stanieri LEGE 03274]|uniref:tRNA-specific adenosine deaminase n=1 Tax=Cyanobacterium stanieri LEGE 03274 TaxID=1828756 RepID=A0ABR9V5F7_9CHRO|nr:tRNA adenosine(34) deaminase TadA [Cyanobacterium stanieri]MBE9223120.1 nucleoside deaminase [Cyanobacterium stanieri LEGE 03274]
MFDSIYQKHLQWMSRAYEQAQEAGQQGEIPVGAIIVDENNQLIAIAHNRKEKKQDATAHAEILAINQASQIKKNWRLDGCTLYVTLEPCPMCTGAIIHSRISTLVYGVDDYKTGAVRTVINLPDSHCSNHALEVIAGIKEKDCKTLLQQWFKTKRNL